ncbi:hypothetical protein HanRHA438_Chr09g0390591 [Helianthus annuus]|nr:hypothetical protein HanRHA438_Chr09g0390591 [Helianthus annuus]
MLAKLIFCLVEIRSPDLIRKYLSFVTLLLTNNGEIPKTDQSSRSTKDTHNINLKG